MMKSFTYILFLILFNLSSAQNSLALDSLKKIITVTSNDSIKMDTYNKLRRATYYSDAASSRTYTQKYLKYAEKIKDSHNIILARFFLGNAALMHGNYDSALKDYLIAANYYERKKDSARLTSVLNSLGAVYEKTEQDSLSLTYYLQARVIGKSLKDLRRSGIASVNIGNIYIEQGKYDEASRYLDDAIKDLDVNASHKSFLILAETNLANVYGKMKKYDEALQLYDKILKNIDTISDIYNHANVLRGKSFIYVEQEKFSLALPLLRNAYKKYTENNFGDERFQSIPELIRIYKNTNKNKEAVALYEEYLTIKDSILYSEQEQNIADAFTKYETEKKEAQLKVYQLEKDKSKQRQLLLIVIALSSVIIAGSIGIALNKNQKKKQQLAKQKLILEKTIDDKNILLRETHHRVKNSFQMVSSLLSYQANTVKDEEAKLAIKEAQNRVRSMILIHQKLYSKDQLIGIDSKEYVEDFAVDVVQSHDYRHKKIECGFNVESLILDVETITPIGLILNELLTNCIKHAFSDDSVNNQVQIYFRQKEDTLVLIVSDNGLGLTDNIKDTSFGLKLIKTLAKKLKGDFYISDNHPTGVIAQLTINRFTIL